ncbi:hypothetical protein SHL15_0035 [Streptomyces hygroscopicus subsp. limoneus]|nr:hypothetical protein SHL15_0035 [Streptomyces hygroscopicus subsp. limoneus]
MWLADDWAQARVPDPSSSERLISLVQVWSEWADEPCDNRRWRTMLEQAQPPSTPRPPVQEPEPVIAPGYRAWIEQNIAPDRLLGREPELRELAAFASGADYPGASPYMWWQAGAWAGKSALVSDFVLRHRPDDVEIVAYFIADRLGRNDREGFLEVVMRQLASLAGQDPVAAGFSMEDFPGLCQAAAQACQNRGRRLLLVVDGLDEDHGAGRRSIAALLPRHPPAGMRIVVTGRPHPLIPDDVPDDHPLRLAHIVRALVPSPHATGISRMARRELDSLLKDEQVGVPLLGLLTAARGSLTAADLARLADVRPYQVEQLLRGITGRSFVPGSHGQILLPDASAGARPLALGHTELRDRVLSALGDVSEFEDRLHAWADGYRGQGWPPDTPDYLLYDYSRMLYSTEDSERLTTIALDPRRQRALLGRASLDAAFSDIDLSARMIRRRRPDDLTELAALAALRAMLMEQARAVPVGVAVAFARLGHHQRSLQFALMAPHPAEKASRLASVARTLEETGDRRSAEAAREAARWAERARAESAPTSGDEDDAEAATAQAAVALIAVGDHDQGCALLKSLRAPSPYGDVDLLAVTAAQAALAARPRDPALAEELLEQAEQHADDVPSSSPSNPSTPVTAWAHVASAAGPERAARLHARITQYAQSFPPSLAACTVDAAAASALATEHPEGARALALQAARRLTSALNNPEALPEEDASTLAWLMGSMLTDVTRALMDTGCVEQARTLVDGAPEATYTAFGIDARARALAELTTHDPANEEEPFLEIPETLATRACRLAAQDQSEQAHRVLHRALQALGSRQTAASGEGWLITLCTALAVIGRPSDGALLARSLRDPADRVQALAAASVSAGAAGNLVEARHLAHEAADSADSLQGGLNFSIMDGAPGTKVSAAKSAAAQALAHIGERDRALALAEETDNKDSGRRRRALIAVATGLRSHDPATATATAILDRELERLRITDAPVQGPPEEPLPASRNYWRPPAMWTSSTPTGCVRQWTRCGPDSKPPRSCHTRRTSSSCSSCTPPNVAQTPKTHWWRGSVAARASLRGSCPPSPSRSLTRPSAPRKPPGNPRRASTSRTTAPRRSRPWPDT